MAEPIDVQGMKWEQFLAWFTKRWEPGQHMSLVGPTGTGKTTTMVPILKLRKYVLALDPKGGDSSLAGLRKLGFVDSEWPLRNRWGGLIKHPIRKQIEEGKPARLIIGAGIKSSADLPKLRRMISEALRDSFDEQGWTVYIDELQIVADMRLMNLRAAVERNLIAARDRKVSMVMSFQRPANVPRSAAEMSTWFVVLYTRDRDTVDRLAEMAGRPSAEMRGMVRALPQYCVLIFSRNPREPVIVTKANKI